jgi:hypothetical protein
VSLSKSEIAQLERALEAKRAELIDQLVLSLHAVF